jgi:cation diffusion facilitator CzcD-associated flavoprotein CzcO
MRFVVIGAGMAGILAAIRLREAGYDDVVVYEKADRPGGTWRENTYPGLACDVPSHFYSYSFAPNAEWTRRFSPGAEIQAYFDAVAQRYGVLARTRFGAEIVHCAFEDGRWRIATRDGATDVADVVVAATGVLHHPKLPDVPGLETFRGAAFHSARWDHAVPLDGRRIGVVGTGSSAVQIVTALASRAAELVLFQRTPQWISPTPNPAYSEEERAHFRANPDAIEEVRRAAAQQLTDGFANIIGDLDSPILQMIHDMCVNHLETSVRDPELREKLRPSYRAACKRLVMSDGFYEAIQRPNARLVSERIDRVEPEGVRTADGTLHVLDVLVLATGFHVDWFVRPMQVVGRDGVRLDDVWSHGATAYMSLTVPGFPNFFMLNGPSGPVGNFSLIEVAELQCDYVLQLVDELRRGACREIAPSADAMARFDAERREAAKHTIWSTGCKSWYLDETGIPTAWPFTFDRFRQEMGAPRLADFERR